MGNERLLNWVTACAGILGMLGAVGTLPLGDVKLSYSIALGAGIAVLNLFLLRRLGRRMVAGLMAAPGTPTDRGKTTALFLLKFVLLIGGLWLLFEVVPLNALGMLGGLSTLVLAVLMGTLFGPAPAPEEAQAE